MSTVSPTLATTSTSQLITLAAGCFWGVESVFRKRFQNKGLVDIKVGYANGHPSVERVSYEKVCLGATDFVESVQILYESDRLPTAELLDIFFRIHDPTQLNHQGPDQGTQYRLAILTHTDEQQKLALEARDKLQAQWYPHHKIVTIIEPIKIWHDAEEYHQKYLTKNPGGYECPTHFLRTTPKQ
jgi:peptide-methionine (S)-S-oxide reductase